MTRLALALALAGCYDPRAPVGAPCSASQDCPASLVCTAVATGGLACVAPGTPVVDAPVAIDGGIDAPIDGPPIDGSPAAVPWTLLQAVDVQDATALALAATHAGNLLVVALETDDVSPTAVTDDRGDTFVAVPGALAVDNGTGAEIWIAANAKGGATAISVATTGAVHSLDVWEVAGLRATNPVDVVGAASSQATAATVDGAQVTTTAAGDFVVGLAIVSTTLDGLTAVSQFTNDLSTYGNGWAHLTSAAAPAGTYRPRWVPSSAGTFCAITVALFAARP